MKRGLPLILAFLGFSDVWGADWPQFRFDASRSASSPEQLPETLVLQWMRHLPEPRPAFPGETRLWFDASYEPVVQGQTMFVPSMVTDSLTALDTETGAERWRFFTEGPVRFAPVVWEGKVYFISDDGHLYCLSAADGNLCWKFRSLPPGKKDRKLFGSNRLISLFPARGGPVLKDGVVYFGAGIWSGYGVAIHALDARSGQVLWSNTDSNRLPKANMDHGVAHDAGLTPQGYLAVVNDTLVVPCGAQLTAFLDLKTGKLGTYTMGWGGRNGLPKGTWFVAGSKNLLSHSGDLYDLNRPNDEKHNDPRFPRDFKRLLYPGGRTRLWIDASNQKDLGAFQEPVFASDVLYTSDRGIAAIDLSNIKLEERKKYPIPPSRKEDPYPDKWLMNSQELWRIPSKMRVSIKAGQHLYACGPGAVEAIRLPQGGEPPRVVWRATVAGTPHRLLAAQGKLFVVTREGTIFAFGGEKKPAPLVYVKPTAPPPTADAWTTTAADILQRMKNRDGYALVLGIGTGRLVEELIRQSDLSVIALDRDADKVHRLRQRLFQAGWYGSRASALVGDPLSFSLPPYMACLIASENWADLGTPGRTFLQAIFPLLRPYGGTAFLALPPNLREALVREVTESGFAGISARAEGDWVLVSREGSLPGASDWSHAEADAANTGASEEHFVKAPLELLWFDTPPRWYATSGFTLVRVGGGCMFIKSWKLHAYDVYTGRRLWETALPFSFNVNDQMVVVDDALYLASGKTCLVLDPATGRKKGQIDLPAGLTAPWANLRVWQGYLVGQSGQHLVCLHRHSGRLGWKYECGRRNLSLALGGGKVFFAELTDPKGKGQTGKRPQCRALDIQTGKLVWQIPGGSEVRYCPSLDRVVLFSGIYHARDGSLAAALPDLSPKDAKTKPENVPKPLFVIGRKVLMGTAESFVVCDLQSGQTEGKAPTWKRRGCTIPRAGSTLVTTRVLGNAACIDLDSREFITFWNVRAACSNNLFPADGVLNMPSLTLGCTCNYLPVSQAYISAPALQGVNLPQK